VRVGNWEGVWRSDRVPSRTSLFSPLFGERALSREAGRRVVDKTELSGNFDWDLAFTPQPFHERSFDRDRFPSIDPSGPSVFTAVQEQLGLKLESRKGEGSVLVIDHVEHPTEN